MLKEKRMKKFCITFLSVLMLLTFLSPVWADGATSQKAYLEKLKAHIQQKIIEHQLTLLKKLYDKSDPDARLLFLEFLGSSIPSTEEQITMLRAEYERQIAELNAALTANQLQLAAYQQQLDDYQLQLDDALAQAEAACSEQLAQAYLDWQAAAGEPSCPSSGPFELEATWDLNVNPFAIDGDNAGNIVVLDRSGPSLVRFDSAGTQLSQWNPGTLMMPMDIAVDSQGNVYVVDQQAAAPLQKFSAGGNRLAFESSISIFFPQGIYIDSTDTIYVTDMGGTDGRSRVTAFNLSGNFLYSLEEVDQIASEEFRDVVVDESNQRIYVVSTFMVARFDMDGSYLDSWDGDFRAPYGIAVAANGDVIIADTFNDIIHIYKPDGDFRYSFANDLYRPYRIFTDSAGRLFVTDYYNAQIKIYK
jgi:streptogramin lyase